jgi:hypothetical protein
MSCFLDFLEKSSAGLWGLVGTLIATFVAWRVVHNYTRESKRVETTLALSRRYQELFSERHNLNKLYKAQREPTADTPKWPVLDDFDARNWYRQYFDLLLNEYRFYKRGIIDKADFVQWMRWARSSYNSDDFLTCGMTYKDGWEWWCNAPNRSDIMRREPIADLLAAVHNVGGGDIEILVDRTY